jgi:hypothetical protein
LSASQRASPPVRLLKTFVQRDAKEVRRHSGQTVRGQAQRRARESERIDESLRLEPFADEHRFIEARVMRNHGD